jgi:hypothetical protein
MRHEIFQNLIKLIYSGRDRMVVGFTTICAISVRSWRDQQ